MEFIYQLDKDPFDLESINGISIVNFYTNWSFYSKLQNIILKNLRQENENNFKIYDVNCESNNSLVEKFGIKFFPTLLFLKNGVIVSQLNGLQKKCSIEETIKKIIQ